jgi:uncharacterized membrane protein YcgQ (UPF0703/DUF1980 family)
MKILARILAPLTLLEWGGILTYFYFSGRITAFLHPMFRPLVLVTGILLLITAACIAISREEESEHGHQEEVAEDRHQHSHSHDRLSFGGLLAFVVLLLPLALAAKISPDSYGANLIKNRGLVEDIRSIPSAASSFAHRAKFAEWADAPPTSEQEPSLPVTADATPSPKKYIGVPEQTPIPGQNIDSEPALPSNDYEQPIPPSPSASPPNEFVNESLKPDKSGRIKTEIIDLLYAAQEPFTRKDFEGKDVELIGQVVPNKLKAGVKSTSPTGSFKLLRLVMVCCAADAMPVAVKIETKQPLAEKREMQWLKVTGRVHYRPRSKADSDDIDYGDQPEPVIVADSIKKISAPREKYLY